ncbi:MAG: hypothetical protein CL398_12950, partial [Acidiferrobacteraceae bacterium]|nr:hypothetical protein [Acidiferrobacteraceae bacterium]
MNNVIIRVAGWCIVVLITLHVILLFSFNSSFSFAAKEESPKLICSKAFPCPPEIIARVYFWIDVYSRWNSNDAIFHDSEHPSRVYKVAVGENCGVAAESSSIEARKHVIASELHSLASRLRVSHTGLSPRQSSLLSLFPSKSAHEIEIAADRIRCQSGNRDRFRQALDRYSRYSALVIPVLRDAGLPADIKYLPFVESLYSPVAYSRSGAAGLWQIMPATAKELGLKLTAELDERLDPELASKAAARYFVRSFHALMAAAKKIEPDSTPTMVSPFIVTSYNYGINGMRRAIEQHGPDYVSVVNNHRSPAFQVAVKNFYASFLAARHVAKHANVYFSINSRSAVLEYETIVLRNPASMERLIAIFGVEEDELKRLNPALTRFVWYGWRLAPAGYRLRLPTR